MFCVACTSGGIVIWLALSVKCLASRSASCAGLLTLGVTGVPLIFLTDLQSGVVDM